MNREAAALGIPTYSIFAGRVGAVDAWLAGEGRLQFLSSPADLERIAFCHSTGVRTVDSFSLRQWVTEKLLDLAAGTPGAMSSPSNESDRRTNP